jgi:hypothetical protein
MPGGWTAGFAAVAAAYVAAVEVAVVAAPLFGGWILKIVRAQKRTNDPFKNEGKKSLVN